VEFNDPGPYQDLEKLFHMSAPRLLEDVKQALKARFAIKSNYRDESWQTLECEREFKRYDLDGSGHLGREEFGAALEGLNIFDRTQHKLLFDAFDFDGSGFISIREFSNMLYAPAVASPQDNAKTQVLMERLREGIAEHGGENGMNQLRNLFSRLDADSSGSLSGDELKIALRAFGIQVSNSDLALLVNAFDVDHDGTITVAEFLRGVRGKMSSRRVDLVTKVFNAVDRMKQGYLTVEDIEIAFNPSVLGGDFSHKQALAIINQLLDPDSKGSISLEDFLNYYRDLSVCIADNERFANKLKAAWLPAASINSSFLSTSAAPRPASRSGSNASTPQRRLSNLGSALGRSSPIATKLSRPVSGSATPNKAANPLSNNWIDEAEEKTSVETSSPSKKVDPVSVNDHKNITTKGARPCGRQDTLGRYVFICVCS
jgi:Ca2+-binding EF-hand superfamily protein